MIGEDLGGRSEGRFLAALSRMMTVAGGLLSRRRTTPGDLGGLSLLRVMPNMNERSSDDGSLTFNEPIDADKASAS
jgi:hypothetical protein